MDTTETILMEICRSLLKEISESDHIEITEVDAPYDTQRGNSVCLGEKVFVTYASVRWPTCGKTRVESLGWMAAQALAQPGLSEAVTTKVHALLMQHGIVIPTREEYDAAVEKAAYCSNPVEL